MIDISNKIFVFQGFIDMRKSIDGLSILVETSGFEIDVGSCFLFINKGGEKIKILVRDHNGFLLIYKRLDRGKFHLKLHENHQMILTNREARWLLDGLDWSTLKIKKTGSKKVYF